MDLAACLDVGAALVPTAPCLVTDTSTLSYAEVQGLSRSIAASLGAHGVRAGSTVAVLSANDPLALTCVLGASRAGAAWVLTDPTADVDQILAEIGGCSVLLFRTPEADLVRLLQPRLAQSPTLVCLDGRPEGAIGWGEFLVAGIGRTATEPVASSPTGSGAPVEDRPVFLALGRLTESRSTRWQPVLAQGGRIVMRSAEAAPAELERLEA